MINEKKGAKNILKYNTFKYTHYICLKKIMNKNKMSYNLLSCNSLLKKVGPEGLEPSTP